MGARPHAVVAAPRVLAVVLTLALSACPLVAGCSEGLRWVTISDPHGFRAEVPSGWDARVEDSGLVLFQPAARPPAGGAGDHPAGPAAFVWPLFVGEDLGQENSEALAATAAGLLDNLWPLVFGDWPKGSSRWLENRGVLVATIGKGISARGMALLSVSGGCGLLSGWWAPPDDVPTWRPLCLRILRSFAYDPGLLKPDEIGVTRLITWTDPTEGAFSIGVPPGWDCQGGVSRPYLDAAFTVRLTQGERLILFEQPRTPIYACPNWVLDLSGFPKGSSYPTGPLTEPMVVWNYLSAPDYVRDRLVPELARSFAGLKVVSVQSVTPPQPKNPLVAQVSGATATLTDDAGMSYGLRVTTQLISTPGSPGLWLAAVTLYRSPPEEAEATARLVEAIGASARVDPAWAAREAQAVAERTKIISQTGEDIAAIISETFAYQSAVKEHTAHEWSNAILGRTDVYDSDSGRVWNVPAGSQSYWLRGSEIWGSAGSSPPAPDPDFVELEELGG